MLQPLSELSIEWIRHGMGYYGYQYIDSIMRTSSTITLHRNSSIKQFYHDAASDGSWSLVALTRTPRAVDRLLAYSFILPAPLQFPFLNENSQVVSDFCVVTE